MLGIGSGESLDMLWRSQDVVPQRVPTEEEVLKIVKDKLGRVVFIAINFF